MDFITGSLIQPPTSPAHPLLCSYHLFCNPTEPLTIPFAPGLSPCTRLCFIPRPITSATFNSFAHPHLSAQLSSTFESIQSFPFCFCKQAGKFHNWVNWCHYTPMVSKLSQGLSSAWGPHASLPSPYSGRYKLPAFPFNFYYDASQTGNLHKNHPVIWLKCRLLFSKYGRKIEILHF